MKPNIELAVLELLSSLPLRRNSSVVSRLFLRPEFADQSGD